MTDGTKYHPLFEHLLFSGQGRMSMSFAEIEQVIGGRLPPSARQRQEWWANSPSGHSQARAWLRANYRASHVDLANERVDFKLEGWPEGYRKPNMATMDKTPPGMAEPAQASYELPRENIDHPLFGIWTGKVTLCPGHDYTRPAFEPDVQP
ncbi:MULTISPECIES: hypothetical protein [unclassified Mesorhizobium]|uniref:DUF7662 domain-containing protein n=1 Tax=unclassified Mesorhizobium TaxID=325217 RepID=UPI00112CE4DC|nr:MULTISPECIES: hypothetical protein [unclassified Mesorhizobium]MBZ9897907.1 hypothetical protein [Mesorhizobium sp. BR1-1-6]TPK47263.1 hypothetical protein FJ550_23545 [Mesorhizobium sp. B2-5-2]TPK66065.1 hypothetical protein FJ551_08085 [Mesorhizobium sp. B2-5-1]TPL22403.1 hypothetical protein FJ945_17450 [Mesorhizobium sp. B2-4-9]TPL26536.1 hypothetical protein FJ946_11850 [Mesorhizobium sp. B2-4-7]